MLNEVCDTAPETEKKSDLMELESGIGRLEEVSADLKMRANDLLSLLNDDGDKVSCLSEKDCVPRQQGKNRFVEAKEVVSESRERLLRIRDVLGEITCMVNK